MTHRVEENAIFTEDVTIVGDIKPERDRTELELRTIIPFPIPWGAWRTDDFTNPLPGAGSTTTFGLVAGTAGTTAPSMQSADVKALGAVTIKARCTRPVDVQYEASKNLYIRLTAGMVTTIADTSATLDVSAYKMDGDGTLGSDLVTTSAQDINSLTFANYDFVLDASALEPGDELDILVTAAINDSGTGTAVIGSIGQSFLLQDIRG